jgi:hypothetical protein
MNSHATLQIGFFVVSAIAWTVAATTYKSTKRFLQTASTAVGTIVENVRGTDSEGQPTYYARFAFESPDGREIVVESSFGTNPPSFRPRQQVVVLFDPSEPKHARIQTFAQLWGVAVVFAVLGSVFLGADIFLLWHN